MFIVDDAVRSDIYFYRRYFVIKSMRLTLILPVFLRKDQRISPRDRTSRLRFSPPPEGCRHRCAGLLPRRRHQVDSGEARCLYISKSGEDAFHSSAWDAATVFRNQLIAKWFLRGSIVPGPDAHGLLCLSRRQGPPAPDQVCGSLAISVHRCWCMAACWSGCWRAEA